MKRHLAIAFTWGALAMFAWVELLWPGFHYFFPPGCQDGRHALASLYANHGLDSWWNALGLPPPGDLPEKRLERVWTVTTQDARQHLCESVGNVAASSEFVVPGYQGVTFRRYDNRVHAAQAYKEMVSPRDFGFVDNGLYADTQSPALEFDKLNGDVSALYVRGCFVVSVEWYEPERPSSAPAVFDAGEVYRMISPLLDELISNACVPE